MFGGSQVQKPYHESMVIGYIKRIGMMLSPLAVRYLDELKKYEDCIL